MSDVSDSRLENVTFFHQALDKAIAYRLSFVQREAQNHHLLECEMPNLWEAIRQSYQHQAWERVSAFRDALQPFLDLRGYWAQSLTLNEWACEAAQAVGDAVNAVRWTHDRADILHQRGEYREAERLYQACEEAYRALGENAMALKSRHGSTPIHRGCPWSYVRKGGSRKLSTSTTRRWGSSRGWAIGPYWRAYCCRRPNC